MSIGKEFYLHIDSRDRISGTINNFNYQYTAKGVNVNYNEPYTISLKKLEFPAGSIYQINSTNNIFRYQLNSTIVALNIDFGNYTINELLGIINADIVSTIAGDLITDYSVVLSYNNIFNKVGIIESGTNAGSNYIILLSSGSSNMNSIFGLTSNITSSTTIQYLQNQVDVSPLDYVFLRCGFCQSSSFINNTSQGSDVLYKIQLASQRNSKIYLNEEDIENNDILVPRLVSSMNFYLTDRLGNLIDTNGIDYSMTLKIKGLEQ